ncbi:MAG: hypothetical protein ACYC7F_04500 [Gemmatimonadaceae bacterium]
MNSRITSLALLGSAFVVAACGDPMSANERLLTARTNLASAFETVPVGYTQSQTTYNASGEGDGPMFPGAPGFGLMPGRHGMRGGPFGMGALDMGGGMGPMMGGGLGDDFVGGKGLGHEFGHGRHGDPAAANANCTYDALTQRAVCTTAAVGGLTINRSIAWYDAAGVVMTAFDSAKTDAINTKVTVSGSLARRDSATSTVDNASDRTVSGLAAGSTRHTVNGIARGKEVTVGKDSGGTFTATRLAADTVRNVIVPVADTGRTYPTSGTVIRVMSISVVRASGTTSSSRREVVTYDGTNTARMVVTQDGTTKTCTMPLPMGRPTCQ